MQIKSVYTLDLQFAAYHSIHRLNAIAHTRATTLFSVNVTYSVQNPNPKIARVWNSHIFGEFLLTIYVSFRLTTAFRRIHVNEQQHIYILRTCQDFCESKFGSLMPGACRSSQSIYAKSSFLFDCLYKIHHHHYN